MLPNPVRQTYDRQLQELREDILLLGNMVEKAVSRSVEALRARDGVLAQQVIDNDEQIDDRAYQSEEKALRLIATQQPMARDLRVIAGVLFIISELERIGDYAE